MQFLISLQVMGRVNVDLWVSQAKISIEKNVKRILCWFLMCCFFALRIATCHPRCFACPSALAGHAWRSSSSWPKVEHGFWNNHIPLWCFGTPDSRWYSGMWKCHGTYRTFLLESIMGKMCLYWFWTPVIYGYWFWTPGQLVEIWGVPAILLDVSMGREITKTNNFMVQQFWHSLFCHCQEVCPHESTQCQAEAGRCLFRPTWSEEV